MGITTLLSMTVFLMLVAENMPPTSDVLPLVGEWLNIFLMLCYIILCYVTLCCIALRFLLFKY